MRNAKKHYFLLAGDLLFKVMNEGEPAIVETKANTILTHDDINIPALLIAKAQQALTLSAMNELQDPDAEVIKCVVLNVSYLGSHTEKDFYAGMPGINSAPTVQ